MEQIGVYCRSSLECSAWYCVTSWLNWQPQTTGTLQIRLFSYSHTHTHTQYGILMAQPTSGIESNGQPIVNVTLTDTITGVKHRMLIVVANLL